MLLLSHSKVNKLDLRSKVYMKNTTILIFNLKLLLFLNKTKEIKFYKEIKNYIGDMDNKFIALYIF